MESNTRGIGGVPRLQNCSLHLFRIHRRTNSRAILSSVSDQQLRFLIWRSVRSCGFRSSWNCTRCIDYFLQIVWHSNEIVGEGKWHEVSHSVDCILYSNLCNSYSFVTIDEQIYICHLNEL